ncbi:MAG: aminotransferase class I/II-fold pyridoxal phosphate-dependent enzyme, partial [Gemmatimonadota bacterium]
MERRTFLRAGLALAAGAAGGAGAGAAGLGGISVLPELEAEPRRSGGALRLNSNENPLGLAPAARRAVIDGIPEANRYPGSMREQLIEALAAKHGVSNESIVLGNGSTEVLQMTVQGMAAPGGRLILAEPTFEDVPWYAEPFTYRLEAVPLD